MVQLKYSVWLMVHQCYTDSHNRHRWGEGTCLIRPVGGVADMADGIVDSSRRLIKTRLKSRKDVGKKIADGIKDSDLPGHRAKP